MTPLPPLATRDRVIDAVLVVSCGIAQAAALAVAAFATRDAFAALHGGQPLGVEPIARLGFAGILAALCLVVSRQRAEALGQSYAISLRRTLYRQIARLPKSRHEQRRVGALSLRFVGDLSAARLWFGRGLPDVLSAAVVLPGAVAILYALDPLLATVGLVPLGGALLLMGATAWHLEQRHRSLRSRRAGIAIGMLERIAIAPELDLMGRTSKELQALDEQGAALRNHAIARRGRTAGMLAILQIGGALSGLAMLWVASQNGIPPATVAASLSVLALVAIPIQELGSAWDKYCAWRVAREKSQRLLAEPKLRRTRARGTHTSVVNVTGTIDGQPVHLEAAPGEVAFLRGPFAHQIARCISGLDDAENIRVSFEDDVSRPGIAHMGDDHIGLQGSLRRTVTLMCRKRPNDARIIEVLDAFGLSPLLQRPGGLDQSLAANGKGLSAAHTLRLDLSRAVLGQADAIVIASLRWSVDPEREKLLGVLTYLSKATIILAEPQTPSTSPKDTKAG